MLNVNEQLNVVGLFVEGLHVRFMFAFKSMFNQTAKGIEGNPEIGRPGEHVLPSQNNCFEGNLQIGIFKKSKDAFKQYEI